VSFKVAVIDIHMGNLFSVQQACEHVGLEVEITSNAELINSADAVILPGVGAFGDAMQFLKAKGLDVTIKEVIAQGKPFFGICLGMQLLMSESEEFGKHKGLDIIKGKVVRFAGEQTRRIKVPQVGWNQILLSNNFRSNPQDCFCTDIKDGEYMYFVHSFYVIPQDKNVTAFETVYEDIRYSSGIVKDNIFAAQFHPEKSAQKGIKIYENWAKFIATNSLKKKESHVIS
jgi:glutamine amidotransferase